MASRSLERRTERSLTAAISPQGMIDTQKACKAWVRKKLEAWARELHEASENYEQAKKMKWRSAPFKRLKQKAEKKLIFYRKVLVALRAGYVIVPNFPVDVFAIRTNRKTVPRRRRELTTPAWGAWRRDSESSVPVPLIEAGEGRYVNPLAIVDHREEPTEDNKKLMTRSNVGFDEIQFPTALVKPQVLKAVRGAMELNTFDRIGLANNRSTDNWTAQVSAKGDPIILGHIVEKRSAHNYHVVSFFIAWWLDLEDI